MPFPGPRTAACLLQVKLMRPVLRARKNLDETAGNVAQNARPALHKFI
jgi:hypothetical protein